MKFSAALIVFFFSIAHTRPAPELADGQVSNAPIDVCITIDLKIFEQATNSLPLIKLYHNPDDDAKLKCGSFATDSVKQIADRRIRKQDVLGA